MNKKKISIICTAVAAICAIIGGLALNGMHTDAIGAQMIVSAETLQVKKDDEIKITVTASDGEAMSYVKADLSYDPEKLEFVQTSTDLATGANGEIQIVENLAYGETERVYELTFKALEVGTTDLVLHDVYIEGYESVEMTALENQTTTVEVIVNDEISEDARIKNMIIAGVDGLDQIFDPDVLEYHLEVGPDMDMFISSVIPMQENSVVTSPEDLTLNMGENRFEISVMAPAGNVKTYVFYVTRLDHEPVVETEVETEVSTVVETESETESETEVETEVEATEETVVETEVQ